MESGAENEATGQSGASRRSALLVVAILVVAAVGVSALAAVLLLNDDEPSESSEVVVFLERETSDADRATLEQGIQEHPDVESFRYIDQEASRAEFEDLFAHSPAMLDRIRENPDLLPTSYRIVPTTDDVSDVEQLTDDLCALPGVFSATYTIDDARSSAGGAADC